MIDWIAVWGLAAASPFMLAIIIRDGLKLRREMLRTEQEFEQQIIATAIACKRYYRRKQDWTPREDPALW